LVPSNKGSWHSVSGRAQTAGRLRGRSLPEGAEQIAAYALIVDAKDEAPGASTSTSASGG